MSLPYIQASIPYIQASMANVRAVDGTYISYPFLEDGDTSTKVYNMVCTQRASDYDAAQIALDDTMSSAASAGVIDLPFAADSSAYFVGDTGHDPIGGGMLQFTRTFSNIPETTTTPSGSAIVTFPGVFNTRTVGSLKVITGLSMSTGTRGVIITTGTNHGLVANNNIDLTLSYRVGSDPFTHSIRGDFRVLSTVGLDAIIVDIGHYWGGQVNLALDSGRLVLGNLSRESVSKNVSTSTRYDYILPGVTPGISSGLDINMPPAFSVIARISGESTSKTSNGGLVGVTMPTATEYLDMIENDKNIVIESSLSEWAGNILVMKTKTCKAR